MPDSILEETKEVLGVLGDDFNLDVRLHINNAFSTLHQIGIGPDEGFRIADETQVWTDFLAEGPMLDKVKDYVYLKTKYLFDPPGTGYHTTAMEKVIQEEEVRLSYAREETDWVAPVPEEPIIVVDPFSEPIVLDGG